ncbi:RHS repeat domain-containing protein [Victivallis sp. Marseille-Q1083]|uniref:RHS repeat domain-containing protein n=1 Tax=Victivallis sp. Marseille-Q1083 TaxID=2717288 RepID=UPI00158BEE80|nr:RHS repeat-associated core domain-containing protein [Victivallis sp. Marseille-Q1083]
MTVVDAARTRTFTYNAQVALQKESISGIYTKELNRVYTTSGLKGSYSGLNIGTVNLYTYGYDRYSRLNKVTTAAGVFNYTFLADSDLIASMTRPNNVSTNYTYETARDLLTKVANGAISTFRPANGALGRRTGMNRSGSAFTAADVLSYTYNSYSELTGASSNNNASYGYNYTYDPIGNRKTAGLAGTNWTYTANNLNQYSALNQAGTVQNPTYDIDGNMLTRDGWTQTWNAENRLIKAEKGTAKLEFAYDYMGRRIEKKVYNGSTLTAHIRFVYDGYKLIEELNGLSNNAVLRCYVWQPVMLDTPLTVFDATANKTYFYHTDANKNVTDLTDSAGAIVAHYEYSPFGQLVKSSGAYANTNVFTWSSEYSGKETGLIYYNFREYDPKLGRWLSRDPIHEQGDLNLYAYISNKTINHIDKLGLQNFGEGFLPTTIDLLPQIAEQETGGEGNSENTSCSAQEASLNRFVYYFILIARGCVQIINMEKGPEPPAPKSPYEYNIIVNPDPPSGSSGPDPDPTPKPTDPNPPKEPPISPGTIDIFIIPIPYWWFQMQIDNIKEQERRNNPCHGNPPYTI